MRAIAVLVFALLVAACHGAVSPSPEVRVPDAQQTAPRVVDYSCTSDNQCAIKNVGNCCGEYPACVNVDSPTFPEQVKADCARKGVSGICGFPVLEGCQCVEGRCEGSASILPSPAAQPTH